MRARLLLGACVVSWFGFSAVCTACAKSTLTLLAPRAGGCALTLTLVQFVVSALASTFACVLLRRTIPQAPRELLLVSLAYTLGFLLLNCSLGRLQASFSETVRGLEPLTSFVLVRLLAARGAQLSRASASSLLAVLSGAAVSVWAQPAFDVRGFAYGLLANCAFSSRALLVTMLQDATRRSPEGRAGGAAAGVDPVGLFAAQHALGLLLLAPAAFAAEGTQCAVTLTRVMPAARAAALSSLGFVAYNFLSLCVLLLIDAVSHSVCNTCRRAVTIVAAAIVFQNVISAPSAAGIALIIGGSTAYAIASAAGAATKPPSSPQVPNHAEVDALLDIEETKSETETSEARAAATDEP